MSSDELRPSGTLAALNLDELPQDLPAPTVEAIGNPGLLRLEAQAAFALLVGADAIVGNKPSIVRWPVGASRAQSTITLGVAFPRATFIWPVDHLARNNGITSFHLF